MAAPTPPIPEPTPPMPDPVMGKWRISTLIVLGVGSILWYFRFQPPWQYTWIIAGSVVALLNTIADSKSNKLKILFAVMAAAIAIAGGVAAYRNTHTPIYGFRATIRSVLSFG